VTISRTMLLSLPAPMRRRGKYYVRKVTGSTRTVKNLHSAGASARFCRYSWRRYANGSDLARGRKIPEAARPRAPGRVVDTTTIPSPVT
jgi:hypothetical protein